MRSRDTRDELAPEQVKEGPAREAWFKEEVKFEIERLKDVLRDRLATDEERAIAQSQISNYKEMAAHHSAAWLRQMGLLADRCEEHCSMSDNYFFTAEEGSLARATGGVTRMTDQNHNDHRKTAAPWEGVPQSSTSRLSESQESSDALSS